MTAPTAGAQPGSDLYQVLGLDPNASSAQITRAYRRLARRHHPDVDPTAGAAQRFAEITHAYRVLSDPRARARYDASRASRPSRTPTGSHQAAWWPLTTARVRPGISPRDTFWLVSPNLSHAFHLGTDTPADPSGHEEVELELTLDETYHGTTRTVTVTSRQESTSIHVAVPPGLIDGDRIEVPTTHLRGGRDAPPVFLQVRLVVPEGYQLDGRDLHVRLPLSPWEAALGATITFDTPAGHVTIEVPAGTCSGHLLTLPAHGIPNPTGLAGNLYARAHIVVPAPLTPAERDLFHQLATASSFNPRTATVPTP